MPRSTFRHHRPVNIFESTPIDVRSLLPGEREELVALLGSLVEAEWDLPSSAGWSVKDLALHLLDDDLGLLSRNRDGDSSGLLAATDHETFVRALAAKNQRWIDGARHLSPRIIIDLLTWAGNEVDAYYSTVALTTHGHVSWASDEPVPVWLDMAREFTERWVHQMQIREATGRVGGFRDAYLATVLRTFVWAIPHQYRVAEEAGGKVQVDLASGGQWYLVCQGGPTWSLNEGVADSPDASATFSDDCGWRWLTGAALPHEGVSLQGPPTLCEPLLGVRAIVA